MLARISPSGLLERIGGECNANPCVPPPRGGLKAGREGTGTEEAGGNEDGKLEPSGKEAWLDEEGGGEVEGDKGDCGGPPSCDSDEVLAEEGGAHRSGLNNGAPELGLCRARAEEGGVLTPPPAFLGEATCGCEDAAEELFGCVLSWLLLWLLLFAWAMRSSLLFRLLRNSSSISENVLQGQKGIKSLETRTSWRESEGQPDLFGWLYCFSMFLWAVTFGGEVHFGHHIRLKAHTISLPHPKTLQDKFTTHVFLFRSGISNMGIIAHRVHGLHSQES